MTPRAPGGASAIGTSILLILTKPNLNGRPATERLLLHPQRHVVGVSFRPLSILSNKGRVLQNELLLTPRNASYSRYYSATSRCLNEPKQFAPTGAVKRTPPPPPPPPPPVSTPKESPTTKAVPRVIPASLFHPAKADKLNVAPSQVPAVDLLRKEPRGKNESAFKYYFSVGRSFVKFYTTGVKNILANYRLVRDIEKRTGFNTRLVLATASAHGLRVDVPREITRAEFQLLLRSKHDMFRLPVLSLMFLVCGEFLPVVIYLLRRRIIPFLPYTCRTLDQQLTLVHALDARKEQMVDNRGTDVAGFEKLSAQEKQELGGNILRRALPLVPQSSRSGYFKLDNALIKRDGGVEKLGDWELLLAITERSVFLSPGPLLTDDGKGGNDWSNPEVKAKLVQALKKHIESYH